MYLALYRKYRPVSFDDVISQEHITTTLKNQIASGQIAHAYLFTGTRGTGKTSCAKIMAKAVNCLSPANGSPCGECAACKAIAEGSTDIIEIDAASNNGVDSIRQIRDEVIYTPIDCKYKVYIIDEVHMLSGAAFNALLKTLEEPPSHVIFILATTEYYKVPATILSRCQQFLFSKIDPSESAKRLSEIAEKENVKLTPEAAELIARLSDGAMRDALSLLDQCISTGRDIDEDTVRECSGAADSSYLFSISQAAIEKDPPKALELLDELVRKGKDLSRFIEELTSHYRGLMLVKTGGEGFVKASREDIEQYKIQCANYSLEEIMYHIDLISDSLDLINRMKQTGQARLLTEQLLIRLAAPKLNKDISAFGARLGAVEQKLENIQNGLTPVTVKPKAAAAQTEADSDNKRDLNNPQPAENKAESKSAITEDKPDNKSDNKSDKISASEAENLFEDKPAAAFKNIVKTADNGGFEIPPPPDAPPAEAWDLPPLPDEAPPEDYGGAEYFDSSFKTAKKATEKSSAEIKRGSGIKSEYERNTAKINEDNIKEKTSEKVQDSFSNHELNEKKPKEGPHAREALKSENKPAHPQKPEETVNVGIGEADPDLPDTAAPLPQWQEIISCLTPAARGVLTGSAAYLHDGKIYIKAGDAAATQLKRAAVGAKLREATANVMGGRFEIYMLKNRPKKEQKEEDRVTPFLNKASELGIKVTVNQK